MIKFYNTSCEPSWIPANTFDDQSGNKPLPEPMLTQIYVAIWRPYAKID